MDKTSQEVESIDSDTPISAEELDNIVENDEQDEEVIEVESIENKILPITPPVTITETQEEEQTKPSALEVINEERRIAKKVSTITFLTEYAKATNRQVEEVTTKLGISITSARRYIKEYILAVKDSIGQRNYPDSVLLFYNEGVVDEDKKLKFYHMDKLKDIVKKFSTYDVDASLGIKTLNSNDNDTFNSNHRVDEQQQPTISLLNQQQTGWQSSTGGTASSDITRLEDGITSLQLIRFGLTNTFGQGATMKIANMLGMDPTPYLMDEQNLKSLLLMSGATDSRAQYFINWLKTNAHYVSHPVGFLSYGGGQNYAGTGVTPGNANYYSAPQQPPQMGYGSADQIDEMDKFYYDTRVYQKGLPPNHPINRQNLDKYKEEKREEEQLKMIDRRTNIAMRTQMLKSFSMMGGDGQQGGNHSLFSPEMMVMTGNARWEVTGKREDGSNIYQVVPNIGGMPQGGGMGGAPAMGTGGPIDQMNIMMQTMRSMMEMMATIAKPNQSQETFLTSIMQGISQKIFAQPASQIDDLSKAFEFFTKLKGPELPMAGGITDPTVAIETKRMETDKDFGMKMLSLKERELEMKHERSIEGDKEATSNINSLVGGLQAILPELINVGKTLFLKGGGPGAGAAGMGPGGPGGTETTPIQTLIKMEYEKDKQRKAEEARRAEREWQEQMRRRNEDNDGYPSPRQPQQPQPETNKVIIQQPAPKVSVSEEEEKFFSEDTYIPYAPSALEDAIRRANAQIEVLERYKSTVGSVLQEKIANGENEGQSQQPQQKEEIKEISKSQDDDENYLKYLEKYPSEAHDPDYQGPVEEDMEVEEEETKQLPVAVKTEEKEEVDI